MKINLVPNYRKLWKSHTVKLSFLLAVLSIVQLNVPMLAAVVTPQVFAWVTFTLGTLIGILRYIPQESLKTDESPPDTQVNIAVNAHVETVTDPVASTETK